MSPWTNRQKLQYTNTNRHKPKIFSTQKFKPSWSPMALILGICSSSPSFKPQKPLLRPIHSLRRDSLAFLTSSPPKLVDRTQSMAHEISAELSSSSLTKPEILKKNKKIEALEKDPRALWRRYMDWLYQHKDLVVVVLGWQWLWIVPLIGLWCFFRSGMYYFIVVDIIILLWYLYYFIALKAKIDSLLLDNL